MLKSIIAAAAVLFLVSSCSASPKKGPVPTNGQIAELETRLAANPCIGSLDRWERRYRFFVNLRHGDPDRGKLFTNLIDFRLRKAGTFGIRPGLHLEPPISPDLMEIDDTPVDMAWGTFDLTNRKLNVDFCGPNFGG